MWPDPQETADWSHLLKKSLMENFIFLSSERGGISTIAMSTLEKYCFIWSITTLQGKNEQFLFIGGCPDACYIFWKIIMWKVFPKLLEIIYLIPILESFAETYQSFSLLVKGFRFTL